MATTVSYSASAPAGSLARGLQGARALLGRFPLSIIELAMRLGIAYVFFNSAMLKIGSWQQTIALFADEYQVPLLPPELAAYLGTANELISSVLVAVGLFARFGAAALLSLTLIIQLFVYPTSWPDHLLWAGVLGYVLTRGPGALSIDHLIARRLFASSDRQRHVS
jgi:putative oxidoreductase